MVEAWALTQPGLFLDESVNGDLNGAVIRSFLANNNLPFTVESLDAAVRLDAARFVWRPGFGPQAVAPPPARRLSEVELTAENNRRLARVADREQADREKAAEAVRNAATARQKALEDNAQRERDESIIIYRESGDGIDHSATEAARRSAKERWAKAQGRSLAPAALREIPEDRELTTAEMMQFTKEEIALYLKKRHAQRWQSRR